MALVKEGAQPGTSVAAPMPPRTATLNVAGIGRVCIWQGGSLWYGRNAGHAAPHAHHAIQITVALEEQDAGFLLRERGAPHWSDFQAAIVMPHRSHEFDGRGGWIAHVFVEPETDPGRALMRRFGAATITALPPDCVGGAAVLKGLRQEPLADDAAYVDAGRNVIAALAGPSPDRTRVSARVSAAIDFLSSQRGSAVTLAQVAEAVHLSPSRLRHVLVEETGTTFRGLVLWLRIFRALEVITEGRSWTEAAHKAGFADSAHLSRTFRRMFGVSPATLLREDTGR
ncbi:MAG: AraC family transcriptional regulator [Burkholderiales bacterium]|nr:AraC family transcriptional regulator [Burkholderiales bacterium]